MSADCEPVGNDRSRPDPHVIFKGYGPRQHGRRGDQATFTNAAVVSDVNEVVDFGLGANSRSSSKHRPVNHSPVLYLDLFAENNDSCVGNGNHPFVPAFKLKPFSSNHTSTPDD